MNDKYIIAHKATRLSSVVQKNIALLPHQHPDVGAAIGVCLKSYSHLLCILDDTEFHVNQFPFRITTEVDRHTCTLMAVLVWRFFFEEIIFLWCKMWCLGECLLFLHNSCT